MHRMFVAAALAGCHGAPAKPIANPPTTSGTTLAATLERAKAADGDVLLVSAEDGIAAYAPDGSLVADLTKSPARYVHADPASRALYYFVERRLVRLDLASGEERTLATLPELAHKCFFGEQANPLDFVQRDEDVTLDVARGFACVNVQDRNVNMMSVAIVYRVPLDGKPVTHATTFTLDDCREPGEAKEAKGPCEAGDLMSGPSPVSASKRWELVRDADLGEQGDYIYSATFVTDAQTKQAYAIKSDAIAPFDYAAAKAAGKAPDGTCLLPYEATVRWFPHADVAIVSGCGEGGALLVRPPEGVKRVGGTGYAFY